RKRPVDEMIPLPPGVYPALIDPTLFARVADRLSRNQEDAPAFRRTRRPEIGLLRRGLAKCGICGASLVVGRQKGVAVYRCHSDQRAQGRCPVGASITIEELDAAAWGFVCEVLAKPDRIRAHIAFLRANDPTGIDIDTLDHQQHELERKRARISATIAALDDPLAAEDLVGRLALIGKQISTLARDRETIRARQATWQAEIDDLCDLEARCREIEDALARATAYDDRRKLLQLVAVKAHLYPIRSATRSDG
ncbi:MAG TPA: zinc ribbon domain-containing protein, partial [Thermomicrobiales bacterium]|nr:zinc ribbon domain-containing protein [Thermomicrobiales bacterium]